MLSRRWLINERPIGRAVRETDFKLDTCDVGAPAEGQLLVKILMLGFDPSQKAWMSNMAGYAAPTQIGDVMPGRAIAEVIESRHPDFSPGDRVRGHLGWREYAVTSVEKLERILPEIPDELALGLLGSSGRTAYFGLVHVGQPRPGDVLVVSGAAGAIGSIVGQLGKLCGCTVIGIAGGKTKCDWLTEQLGFDSVIDYHAEDVGARIGELCPDGVDVFFDNVGGTILDSVLGRIAYGARVVICGGISAYNAPHDGDQNRYSTPGTYLNITYRNASMKGFLVHYFGDYNDVADRRLLNWWKGGKIRQGQDIIEGFELAPVALMRLFERKNLGKQLLRVVR